MDCPVCIQPMNEIQFFNIKVDGCRFCGGIWFDAGELAKFIQKGSLPKRILTPTALTDARRTVKEGERKCPRCGNLLEVVTHQGVNVDYCQNCSGLWFDRGELLSVVEKYAEDVEKKDKITTRGPKTRNVPEGEEMIRITDAGIFEFYEEEEQQAAAPETKPTQSTGADAVEREIMAGGSKEDVSKAIPKSIKKRLEQKKLITPQPLSISEGGSYGSTQKPVNKDLSDIASAFASHKSIDYYAQRGRYGANDFFMDTLETFIRSFFDVRKF